MKYIALFIYTRDALVIWKYDDKILLENILPSKNFQIKYFASNMIHVQSITKIYTHLLNINIYGKTVTLRILLAH